MKNVRILYDPQHLIGEFVAELISKKFTNSSGTKVDITLSSLSYRGIFETLENGHTYDFVILHLGGDFKNAYSEAKRVRSKFDGVLVAESSSWPSGKEEVLSVFDEYVEPILMPPYYSLSDLLKKYGHLPKLFSVDKLKG